ncbi:MAG TPA: PD-(D/E)XK nuclease family protein [Bryobacteraceae bacterium]|nr:PD-(D/E)XK nuclease family protein [Bryobacteraceae bacterium]
MAEEGLTPAGSLAVEAVAARALHAANLAGDLRYYHPVATLPGFARALARTIQELRLAGVRAEDLAKTGETGADLAKLLRRYERELAEARLADLARVFELARAAAEAGGGDPRLGLPIVALDVPLESAADRAFFQAVAEKSPSVVAAVSCGAERIKIQEVKIFEEILGVAAEDLDPPEERGTLAHLRRNLFLPEARATEAADGAFELFSSPGEGLEAVEIARRMLKLAREGVPFDSMAVLLRSVERYQPSVEEALRRARIPAYFSRGTLRPDTAGRALLALLECAAEKCSASRFAEYLSLAQLPLQATAHVPAEGSTTEDGWVAPQDELLGVVEPSAEMEELAEDSDAVSPRVPARWERLLVDAAVIGGQDRWARRLRGLEREFELRIATAGREDENQRANLERQLEELRELKQFALPVIEQLSGLPASAAWGAWIEQLASLARRTLRRPEAVLSALAELEPMAGVGPVTLDEVTEVLGERLRFLRAEPPPRRYGRVFVGSIEEARGREFAVVFLPGLAEGLFPQRSFEDPLLLDEFRRKLTALLPTRHDRVEQERLRLQLAVGAARDRLIASYPRMNTAEGRPRVPSFYALELPRAIEGRLPRLDDFDRTAQAGAPARLNWPAPADTAEAIDDAEYDLAVLGRSDKNARYLVEVSETLARSLRGRWKRWNHKWWDADGLIVSAPDALVALASHRLTARPWSPSSLQKFAECPYQFALHGILGLKPRDEAEPLEQLDPLTRGGLFHAVQFALLEDLKKSGLLPVTPRNLTETLRHLDGALDRVAGEYEEKLAPAIPRVWQTGVEDLRTDLRGWLRFVASNDAGWEPLHFEFAFGLPLSAGRDPASTADAAALEEGVHLRGSIDLIERETASGALRVTDHKTGKRPDAIPLYVGGGKLLQPLLYGLTAQHIFGNSVTTGRLFYATQRGGYDLVTVQIDEKSRRILARLLANIDASIANGFLPPAPQKDTCERCDYRPVCGPYEEQRFEQEKNRRDERLEALVEIRGMA